MNTETEKSSQIPNEQNSGQAEKIANEQENVPGQRKEVNVQDYPSAAALANLLKDVDFPADKNTIINSINQSETNNKNIVGLLENIEARQYYNTTEVFSATGIANKQ
ncbi:MAG: DUF2795 domain-containing protein [Nitrosopumilus sp.]|nr:DUF2795 domain-containing protein [Nitrosopumilus sp.]